MELRKIVSGKKHEFLRVKIVISINNLQKNMNLIEFT